MVATIIAAMTRATVTNKSMRLMISATSSREGGAEESRLRLYNATTLASGDESAMNLRRRTAVRLIHPTSGKGNSQKLVSAILNIQVHEGGALRLSTGLLNSSQHYIL